VKADVLMVVMAVAVLLSYWYSHLGDRLRVPSVMLLLATGLAARVVTHEQQFSYTLPPQTIPLLGTIGLVLIVLEGALDLRLESGRGAFLLRSFGAAALGIAFTTALIAAGLAAFTGLPVGLALLAAAPFGVISSSVAIPSAETLHGEDREFVIYESSWSDIVGVMLFNALLIAAEGGAVTTHLLGGGLLVIVGGLAIALAVYWLVGHLEGQVKFLPLLFALILVYAGAESLHLSPLLIVLILGLVLNNAPLLRRIRWLRPLHNDAYDTELARLKHLTAELTFLVRTFFFLLLGYSTDLASLADPWAWGASLAILAGVFALRWVVLWLCRVRPLRPVLWVAPRGLITVTLFFSLPAQASHVLPPATLILVVLLSGVLMTLGLKLDGAAVPAVATTTPAT
jgi:NhaP-type Na+/H+ or K+/H+ antiporter